MFRFLTGPWGSAAAAAVGGALVAGAGASTAVAGPAAVAALADGARPGVERVLMAKCDVERGPGDAAGRKTDVSGAADAHDVLNAQSPFGRGRNAGRPYDIGRVAADLRTHDDPLAAAADDAAPTDAPTYFQCWEGKISRPSERGPASLTIEVRTDLPSPSGRPLPSLPPTASAETESVLSEPLLIPLPPALWSGLGGLVGLGVVGAYKRGTRRGKW